jgi:hypothetical protein
VMPLPLVILVALGLAVVSDQREIEEPSRAKARPGGDVVQRLRALVIRRDGPECCWCGEWKTSDELTLEHLRPLRLGGSVKRLDNLAVACGPCNNRRGSLLGPPAGATDGWAAIAWREGRASWLLPEEKEYLERVNLGKAISLASELAEAYAAWDGRGRFVPPEGVGRRLGIGETRVVYEIAGYAVKIPRDPEYAEMNRAEAEAWEQAPPRLSRYLLPVLASDPGGEWLVMPIAEPVDRQTGERFCELVESSAGNVLLDLWHANVGRYKGHLFVWDYPDDIGYAIRTGLLEDKDEDYGRMVE